MHNYFKDKVIWITGASSGYGEALAHAFAKQGAKLILSARNTEKLTQLATQLATQLNNCRVLTLDLSQPDTFYDKTQQAITLFGHIDLVIHNGAIAQGTTIFETPPHVARQIMEVDYFSYTELTQHLLPHFIERNTGHIVVISGIMANLGMPKRTTYAAAKAALEAYFHCLRIELFLAKYNIDITILVPGAMQTYFASKALNSDGSSMSGNVLNEQGCPVDVVAEQSLQAIANKEYESYVGNKDEFFMLFTLSQANPSLGTELLLKKLTMKG
ncbi:SDR family NAD(P)-dependent oxidoreductase [Zophobihabitans entericus]|uniref:SDR family NAD(P)-dependent oxidoreductase n=1 Tax=Zophobihabitans entericus TaxID=1635327 RepID=A0A6G9IA10_9GAMM|nr:SDR family NAD(P)-dependent oxidoreductase [Zophobihabitans entericus]QIQ21053.1 SDR family NAD(P)-dependent oxidoreductase [Zophobihabitans entericus]